MTGPAELFRFDIRVDKCLGGFRAIRRGYSGSTPITLKGDRYGEIRFVNSGGVAHHKVQFKRIAPLFRKRHANQATSVVGHEIAYLGGCGTGSRDNSPYD